MPQPPTKDHSREYCCWLLRGTPRDVWTGWWGGLTATVIGFMTAFPWGVRETLKDIRGVR